MMGRPGWNEVDVFAVEEMETGSENDKLEQNSIYPKVLIPLNERKALFFGAEH